MRHGIRRTDLLYVSPAARRRKRFDEHIKTYISFCVGSLHRKRQQKRQTETENILWYMYFWQKDLKKLRR